MKDMGLKTNIKKTVFLNLRFNVDENLDGDSDFNRQEIYLRATLAENGHLEAMMTHIIQSGVTTGRGYR